MTAVTHIRAQDYFTTCVHATGIADRTLSKLTSLPKMMQDLYKLTMRNLNSKKGVAMKRYSREKSTQRHQRHAILLDSKSTGKISFEEKYTRERQQEMVDSPTKCKEPTGKTRSQQQNEPL